jgi:Tetracyclin repressor-like, C-terminal domain
VSHFLDRWEGDEALIVLLRSSTTNEVAAQRMHEIFVTQLEPMAATLVPADAARRAGLVATQILGLALSRYVLRLPPVAGMTRVEIVAWIAPTIQRYLTP